MYKIIKRTADIILSIIVLLILLPVLFVISLLIILTDGFPVFYFQRRVGKNWKEFNIIKFRTMVNGADKLGPGISVNNDSRITKIGKVLRKFKLDELPQFINVLKGEMSLVGPRPELLKYANNFSLEYSKILSVKPGISDFASIAYKDEARLLDKDGDSEEIYLEKILPEKIKLYNKYIEEMNFFIDIKILLLTIKAIL